MNNKDELAYLTLMNDINTTGNVEEAKGDTRTGVWAKRSFNHQLSFDLTDNRIPLLNTKKIFVKSALGEIAWLLRGDTKYSELLADNCMYWAEWPLKQFNALLRSVGVQETGMFTKEMYNEQVRKVIINGESSGNKVLDALLKQSDDMGPFYGAQLRRWNTYDYVGQVPGNKDKGIYTNNPDGHDQLAYVVSELIRAPYSRRMITSMWNPPELDDAVLYPCAYACSYYVEDGTLHTMLQMRSADMFLGVPYNAATYGVYTHVVARLAGLKAGSVTIHMANTHVYNNHEEAIAEQCGRTVEGECPRLILPDRLKKAEDGELLDLSWLKGSDFEVTGYDPQGPISAEVAV